MRGEVVDQEAVEIGSLYKKTKQSGVETARGLVELGQRLILKKEAVKADGQAWKDWLYRHESILGFGERSARRLISCARETAKSLKVNEEKRTLASAITEETAPDIVKRAWGHQGNADNYRAQGTGENEWYTPPEIVETVTNVLDGIDLDPASNKEANKTVNASEYYTENDSGLDQEWCGKVWLNPPYSRELMPAFVEKLITEYQAGRVTEAILVSHNGTDANWFQSLSTVAAAVCFPAKRIKFYRGEDVAAPVNGQCFFYLGNNPSSFINEFGEYGIIMEPRHGNP